MRKRWTAAWMLVAEQQFRRIIGYRDLADLVIAVERHAVHAAPKQHRPPRGCRARYRLTVNAGDRRRSSTTIRTSSNDAIVRVIALNDRGGIGHNLPREATEASAEAVLQGGGGGK
jgi:hypothetical protein